MSVGAGSIKRASKANAETKATEVKPAAEQTVAATNVIGNTSPEVIQMVENMVAKSAEEAEKPAAPATKKSAAKTTTARKPAAAKTAAKKTAASKAAPAKAAAAEEKAAEAPKAGNQPCRLTEEMPVYLL